RSHRIGVPRSGARMSDKPRLSLGRLLVLESAERARQAPEQPASTPSAPLRETPPQESSGPQENRGPQETSGPQESRAQEISGPQKEAPIALKSSGPQISSGPQEPRGPQESRALESRPLYVKTPHAVFDEVLPGLPPAQQSVYIQLFRLAWGHG